MLVSQQVAGVPISPTPILRDGSVVKSLDELDEAVSLLVAAINRIDDATTDVQLPQAPTPPAGGITEPKAVPLRCSVSERIAALNNAVNASSTRLMALANRIDLR